jgi:hypothetical protein
MNRRDRRGPDATEDVVAAAREEAQWGGHTHLYRATNQGKLLFPARGLHGWRRATLYLVAVLIVGPFVLYVLAMLVEMLRSISSS